MIFYVCQRHHAYTQAAVILYYRRDLQAFLRLVPYEVAHLLPEIDSGAVIWSDMDRLSAGELETAARTSERIRRERPDLAQFNHPTESLQRFDLLKTLFSEGINGFNVHRPDAIPDGVRYPVFIREEIGATYETPELLHDRAELDAALASTSGMIRPMIVEFGAKPGDDGYYRKYAAYLIGDRSYAQHCLAQPHWFVKDPANGLLASHRAEHYAFVRENPHADRLKPIFAKAGISYGRIDYTIVDGRVQVFEINTNPTVLSNPPTPFDDFSSQPYADMHAEALLALPHAREKASLPTIDEAHARLLGELRRKYRRKRVKLFARKGLQRLVRVLAKGETGGGLQSQGAARQP